MPYKFTNLLAEASLNAIASELNGGTLHVFAGTVPAEAGDALDMAATHTQIGVYTVGNDGVTGLSFASATGALLAKTSIEDWGATATFSGFQAAATELTPTFWRFCKAGDNGQGSTTQARLQGLAGSAASTAELRYLTTPIVAGADIGIDTFNVRLSALG